MDWITILGLIAAFLTTLSFVPQAIKTIRTKRTKDLSLMMYSLFTLGVFLWLIYGIMVSDLPLILANTISLIFVSITLVMKIKYG
ncbi:SemiSWEET transporter [Candidatus Pacearchaeota archaeon]|nr:SemiSWEET transporter [Candidatus Pacearchaeota archaeon]